MVTFVASKGWLDELVRAILVPGLAGRNRPGKRAREAREGGTPVDNSASLDWNPTARSLLASTCPCFVACWSQCGQQRGCARLLTARTRRWRFFFKPAIGPAPSPPTRSLERKRSMFGIERRMCRDCGHWLCSPTLRLASLSAPG